MKIQCDRFIGWMVDVPIEFFNQVKDEYYKKYCDLTILSASKIWSKDSAAGALLDYGFIGSDYLVDYGSEKINQIVLLINEEYKYVKLICIEELTRGFEDLFVGDNSDNKTLNQFLKQIPVHDMINDKMKRVYQELFKGKEIPQIYLQEFYHWYDIIEE